MALFTSLALTCPAAFAKAGGRKVTPSRSMDPAAFTACVETRLLGRADTECRRTPDHPQCTGLRKSLTYLTRRDECLALNPQGCARRGYAGQDQAEWASTAAGHLAELKECVAQRYGRTEGAEPHALALADPAFQALLEEMDDGSRALGLKSGTVVRRALESERLAHTIARSPFAEATAADILFTIREGADNPLALHSPEKDDTTAQGLARDPALASRLQVYREAQEVAVPASSVATTLSATTRAAAASAPTATPPMPSRTPASQSGSRGKRSVYTLGLDRTIFERVNDAYARRERSLRGFETYVRALPPPAPARDLGELLRKGESL